MTMTLTTDIGYAKQMQYGGGSRSPRRHAVKKDDGGRWVLACNGKPATREYKGWLTVITCQACQAELGMEEE